MQVCSSNHGRETDLQVLPEAFEEVRVGVRALRRQLLLELLEQGMLLSRLRIILLVVHSDLAAHHLALVACGRSRSRLLLRLSLHGCLGLLLLLLWDIRIESATTNTCNMSIRVHTQLC